MRSVTLILLAISFPAFAVGQELPPTYPPPGERGAHFLSIQPADSVAYPAVYPNPQVRDSIDAQYKDHFEAARAIERYMLKKQNVDFLVPVERGDTNWAKHRKRWNVVLESGDTTWTDPSSLDVEYAHFMFEYFYPEHSLILFRVLHGKRVDFAVVSRESGQILDVFGPPVFSQSNHWFASFHDDGLAGWSPNGLQIFRMENGSIQKAIEYDMGRKAPGPTGLRWIDRTTFQLEMRDHHIVRGGTTTNYKHYRTNIRTTED